MQLLSSVLQVSYTIICGTIVIMSCIVIRDFLFSAAQYFMYVMFELLVPRGREYVSY